MQKIPSANFLLHCKKKLFRTSFENNSANWIENLEIQ